MAWATGHLTRHQAHAPTLAHQHGGTAQESKPGRTPGGPPARQARSNRSGPCGCIQARTLDIRSPAAGGRVGDDLHGLGIRHVLIARKGKPGKTPQAGERRPAFRRALKWRTDSEGRIGTLKRGYGWDRTRLDGTEGGRDLDRPRGPWPTTWSRSALSAWPASPRQDPLEAQSLFRSK